jgi:hypothetical protein
MPAHLLQLAMTRISRGALLLLLVPSAPLAAQRLYRLEVSPVATVTSYDGLLELKPSVGGGLRVGYWITGPLSIEAEGTYARAVTKSSTTHLNAVTLGGSALANFGIGTNSSIFVRAGYAQADYGTCPAVSIVDSLRTCGASGVAQGGIGTRIALTPTLMARLDGVVGHSFASRKFTNFALNAGMSVMIGSKPLVDSDGDRVYDRYDDCPGTPLGALVDKHGCATDHDGDSVPDGLDRCPNTEPGASVDAVGCAHDSDGDGYLDGLDQCPDTPLGALVDGRGCPGDSDKDGVLDGLDRCPNSAPGAAVDALGCPEDADADGVADGVDQCPETPQGQPVDTLGCPVAAPADSLGARTWVVPGTAWQLRGSDLDASAYSVLDSVATALKSAPQLQAEINAYAHDRLVPADNTRLSQRRAEAVRAYLVSQGVAAARLTAIGRGSQTLLVSDTTEAARTTNRRMEIQVTRSP